MSWMGSGKPLHKIIQVEVGCKIIVVVKGNNQQRVVTKINSAVDLRNEMHLLLLHSSSYNDLGLDKIER